MRVTWVDTTKGFAIFLVVLGHVWRGLNKAGLLEADVYRAIDSRIYAFHMPLFFLLAGLFFPGTLAKLNLTRFITSRLIRLIYPLLLWTYLFIGFKLLAGSMANTPIGMEELYVPPIPGRWHFWFLWALFLIHLSMLPVKPLVVAPRWQGRGLIILLLGSVALYAANLPEQLDFWVGPAIRHLPYFVLGMIIGRVCLDARIPARGALAAAVVFLLVLAFFPQLYQAGVPYLVTATLLSLGSVAVFAWLRDRGGKAMRALAYAGERSMPIFLAHVIFQAAVRVVLLKFGITSLPVHLILGTTAGLILPIILNDVAIRLKLVKLLGF